MSVHILHDDVGQAVASGPSIKQPCNIRMLQASQSLTFAAETGENELRVHAGPDQFDRNTGPVLIVIAFGKKDCAHASAAQLANQAIGPDVPVLHEFRFMKRDDGVLDLVLNKAAGRGLVTSQQRDHLLPEIVISTAGPVDAGSALTNRH